VFLTKVLLTLLFCSTAIAGKEEAKKSVDRCFKTLRESYPNKLRLNETSIQLYRKRNNRCLKKLIKYERLYEYRNKILDEIEENVEETSVAN
jgi:hypothetical protein